MSKKLFALACATMLVAACSKTAPEGGEPTPMDDGAPVMDDTTEYDDMMDDGVMMDDSSSAEAMMDGDVEAEARY